MLAKPHHPAQPLARAKEPHPRKGPRCTHPLVRVGDNAVELLAAGAPAGPTTRRRLPRPGKAGEAETGKADEADATVEREATACHWSSDGVRLNPPKPVASTGGWQAAAQGSGARDDREDVDRGAKAAIALDAKGTVSDTEDDVHGG